MTVLFATHAAYLEHLAGPRHPERPERLQAVLDGVRLAGLTDAIVPVDPVAATRGDLERVHPVAYLDRIEGICAAGGGRLDADTYASAGSWTAATLAAGAGLTAVRALQDGRWRRRVLRGAASRPPRHRDESMGFCFVNNVAVAAAALADQGERVMIFDYDARPRQRHAGRLLPRPTSAVRQPPSVAAVPGHRPPHRGRRGRGPWHNGQHSAAAGRHRRRVPVRVRSSWSRRSPIGSRPHGSSCRPGSTPTATTRSPSSALAAGDYAPLTRRVLSLVPAGRRLVMLEGGYDLDALTLSSATVLREMAGEAGAPIEATTSGGPGAGAVRQARDFWEHEGLL